MCAYSYFNNCAHIGRGRVLEKKIISGTSAILPVTETACLHILLGVTLALYLRQFTIFAAYVIFPTPIHMIHNVIASVSMYLSFFSLLAN